MRALVSTYRTAGDRIALAAVRGLGRAGCQVVLASDDLSTPSFRSRYLSARLPLPSPIREPGLHVERLAEEVRARGIDVVLPADDYAVYALSESGSAKGIVAPVPPVESYLTAQDKLATIALAGKIGVRAPATRCVQNAREALGAFPDGRYPLVLKLSRGNGAVGLRLARDSDAVEDYFADRPVYSDAVFDFERILVQEFVPGQTHDLCALFDRGRPVVGLTSRRLVTFPRTGGAGILVETTRNREIMECGFELLRALNWHGPAQVEFKLDPRDGKPTLIEINGRLWGTLALSIAAGVNFPDLACRIALGKPLPPVHEHRAPVAFRWFVPYAARMGFDLDGFRSVLSLVRPRRNCRSDIDLSDPAPFLASLRLMLRSRKGSDIELSPLGPGGRE